MLRGPGSNQYADKPPRPTVAAPVGTQRMVGAAAVASAAPMGRSWQEEDALEAAGWATGPSGHLTVGDGPEINLREHWRDDRPVPDGQLPDEVRSWRDGLREQLPNIEVYRVLGDRTIEQDGLDGERWEESYSIDGYVAYDAASGLARYDDTLNAIRDESYLARTYATCTCCRFDTPARGHERDYVSAYGGCGCGQCEGAWPQRTCTRPLR